MTSRYAVFGHPVAHSLSPKIHAAFGRQTGIALDYQAIDVAVDDFHDALEAFARAGGRGANITLPHKQMALVLCEHLSERAERAGAVNTLIRTEHGWDGDNTDGAGLVRDLTERREFDLRERRTLLLGAGGAAHGVAPALLDAGIGELFIINRSPAKADALCDALGQPGRVHSRYWSDLGNQGAFDLIINATSMGRDSLTMNLPMALLAPRALAVDLSYGEAAIAFLAWARSAGCKHVVDGLGMLVEQAAESFERWHGVRPETDPVFDSLQQRSAALATAD
ncbi:MAG TPA: shikimate dehydrogenase [Arenimonas sp.]|uniref:shikimate dehydrogenase n=1 Tax=Arenimonas sp. TaxID=1872635 RepID=UPI002B5F93E0|nr:shikimate dehydrogenase [Arenimonas sp.]HMB56294.1 shikimate dehydrogenase [Arenimonas sp.]